MTKTRGCTLTNNSFNYIIYVVNSKGAVSSWLAVPFLYCESAELEPNYLGGINK